MGKSVVKTLDQLRSFATRFNYALESIVAECNLGAIGFGPYPMGGCYRGSTLFGVALADRGLHCTLVTANHAHHAADDTQPIQRHTWLECTLIEFGKSIPTYIDLTCCQFENREPRCDYPCPFVSHESEWHNQSWIIESTKSIPDEIELNPNGMINEVEILNQVLVNTDGEIG
jgi:hypothetical protein